MHSVITSLTVTPTSQGPCEIGKMKMMSFWNNCGSLLQHSNHSASCTAVILDTECVIYVVHTSADNAQRVEASRG